MKAYREHWRKTPPVDALFAAWIKFEPKTILPSNPVTVIDLPDQEE